MKKGAALRTIDAMPLAINGRATDAKLFWLIKTLRRSVTEKFSNGVKNAGKFLKRSRKSTTNAGFALSATGAASGWEMEKVMSTAPICL